jgi:hypothetical protein
VPAATADAALAGSESRIHRVAEATRGHAHVTVVIVNGSETACPLLSMAATRCAPGPAGGMTSTHAESVPRRSVAQNVARTPSNITLTTRDAAKPRPSTTARAPTRPALGLRLRAGLTLNDARATCPLLSTALMLCRPAAASGTVNDRRDAGTQRVQRRDRGRGPVPCLRHAAGHLPRQAHGDPFVENSCPDQLEHLVLAGRERARRPRGPGRAQAVLRAQLHHLRWKPAHLS